MKERGLTEKQAAVYLATLRGETQAEIARKLGIKRSTVARRLQRARAVLKNRR
jgi:DNA-directed RNA polymerase specialized sigma24 family protein